DAVPDQVADHPQIAGAVGQVGLLVGADPFDGPALDRRRFDVTLLGLLHEFGVRHGILGARSRIELLDDGEHDQADDQPDQEVLEQVVQRFSFGRLSAPTTFTILAGCGPPPVAYAGRKPLPTRKTSRLRSLEALGLRTWTLSNRARKAPCSSAKPSPWKALTTRSPPGCSHADENSSASSPRYTLLAWSVDSIPLILGARSESTRSTLCPASAASSASSVAFSRKSPWTKATPAIGSKGSKSSAMIWPRGPSCSRSTWHQLPGAAPRSTTDMPGRRSLSLAASSISLKAARDR